MPDNDTAQRLSERRDLARLMRTLRPDDPDLELWCHAVARLLEGTTAPVLAFVDS